MNGYKVASKIASIAGWILIAMAVFCAYWAPAEATLQERSMTATVVLGIVVAGLIFRIESQIHQVLGKLEEIKEAAKHERNNT